MLLPMRRAVILLFAAFWLPLECGAAFYSAPAIEATVIDADTHQPLEGVNVVAHWVVRYGHIGEMHYHYVDFKLMEAVTDANGRFHFPAWGPEATPLSLGLLATMSSQDPDIIFFKSDYQRKSLHSEITGRLGNLGPVERNWPWNGETIELKKFTGTPKQYGSMLSYVLTGVGYGVCNWKKIPQIIVALNREDERLKREGVYKPTIMSPSLAAPSYSSLESNSARDGCGSVSEFFKPYTK